MDAPCSDQHIDEISEKIVEWEVLAPYFGLTSVEVQQIRAEHPLQRAVQKQEMLRKWKHRLGLKATYGMLKETFLTADNQVLADEVDKLLHKPYSPSSHEHGVQQKARIAAKHILQKRIVAVTEVIKSQLNHFNNRLKEKGLIAEGVFDPDDRVMKKAEYATLLYSACIMAVTVDSSKFSVVLDVLSEHPLLEEVVQEMAKEGTEAGLLETKLGTILPIKEATRPRQSAKNTLMRKYKHQPTVHYNSLKCTFIGPPRVGKTTTRMRLTEEIINISTTGDTTSESTLLQKPITIQMYEKSDIAPVVLRSHHWKKEDLHGEMQLLLHDIQKDEDDSSEDHDLMHQIHEKEGKRELVAEPSVTSHPAERVSKVKQGLQKVQSKIMKVFLPARQIPAGALLTTPIPARQILSFTYAEKLMEEVLAQEGFMDFNEMGDTVIAHIMDFGGQPEFQEILPLVLRGPALHLVFFNASLNLKDPIHIKFCPQKGSDESCIEYDTRYTTIEMLFQLVSSLYCLSKNLGSVALPSGQTLPCFEPTAILIGTHIDLCTSLADISEEIKKFFKDTEFWKRDFLRTPTKSSSVFYPLNNNHGRKDEIEELQKFIRELIVQRLTLTPLPRSWLLLHIALRHHYEEDGWCTMKQCVDLAAQCNISEEDVKPILHYIHNHIGNVLHYADVADLSDIVFCEPNKLLEAINRVIVLSFVGDCNHPNLAQEIRKTGEVPKELLDQLESQAVRSSPISNKMVISLLRHFKIISELPRKGKIFVPCLLRPKCSSVDLTSQSELEGMDPQPLLIQFEGGYIPVSIFSGLTVELITQHNWELMTENRFRDHLTFICASWSVELIGHSHFLEVRIVEVDENSGSPSVRECCKYSKEILEVALIKVLSAYEHTKKTTFEPGLYCPCTSSSGFEPHFSKFISHTRVMCSKQQSLHSLGNGAVWLRKPKFLPNDNELSGSVRGVEECGETVLEITGSKHQKISWEDYGFHLTVPDGAVSSDVTVSVTVKAILAGQFELPDDAHLVSAIYWVSSSKMSDKEVYVDIQHCAIISSKEEASNYKFIVGKSSQKSLPYTFEIQNGDFLPQHPLATISVEQFCFFGAIFQGQWENNKCQYTSYCYFKRDPERTSSYMCRFLMIHNLPPFLQVVKEMYKDWNLHHMAEMEFEEKPPVGEEGGRGEGGPASMSITLEITAPEERESKEWDIHPVTSLQIFKRSVDESYKGCSTHIPYCQIAIDWKGPETAKVPFFMRRINLVGTKRPNDFFNLHFRPSPSLSSVAAAISATSAAGSAIHVWPALVDSATHAATVLTIEDLACVKLELASLVEWKQLGMGLGLSRARLNIIEVDYEGVNQRLRQVLAHWLLRHYNEDEHGCPTWNSLIAAVDPIDPALAETITKNHCSV